MSSSTIPDNSPVSTQNNVTPSADPFVAAKLPLMTCYSGDTLQGFFLQLRQLTQIQRKSPHAINMVTQHNRVP